MLIFLDWAQSSVSCKPRGYRIGKTASFFPATGDDEAPPGLTGFAMGFTANAMANLDSICEKFGYSRVAYFILPVVGALFIDFINVLMITGFLAFL